MNAVIQIPQVLTPSIRIMRKEGSTRHVLNPEETSLDWTPSVLPLWSFPHDRPVRAGTAIAIVRPGYESSPLGIATTTYRSVNHGQTVAEVTESVMGRATLEGALIDGHGYHTVHSFRLDTSSSEQVMDLPLVSRLNVVHDHTGAGSLRASVVCYLGSDVVIGSKNFTRRLHVGSGARDMGMGTASRWSGVLDAMLETASLQQATIGALLRAASRLSMTEDAASRFEREGVHVAREKPAKIGEPGRIIPLTALDVVIAHHEQRKGKLSWGVWSRRLEGDALSCLETLTGITLPKQLFKRF